MTPPAQRKSRLTKKHYAAADEPVTPAAPHPAAPPEPVKKAPAKRSAPAVKKKAGARARPQPPAGQEELTSYWAAGTYDQAVAAFQVQQDAGVVGEDLRFNEWFGQQLDTFARMSVQERVKAVRSLPAPTAAGRGVQRRHHIPSPVVQRLRAAAAEDKNELGIDRPLGAFAGLAGRWAAEQGRLAHQTRTGDQELPPARPLPRGRRPASE